MGTYRQGVGHNRIYKHNRIIESRRASSRRSQNYNQQNTNILTYFQPKNQPGTNTVSLCPKNTNINLGSKEHPIQSIYVSGNSLHMTNDEHCGKISLDSTGYIDLPTGTKLDGMPIGMFKISGQCDTEEQLDDIDAQVGDCWIVGTNAWIKTPDNWKNVGEIKGPKGEQGEQGIRGPVGPAGKDGPAGVQGLRGPPGLNGPQGPIGMTGPMGTRGLRGLRGPSMPGPQGIQGPPGPPGQSFNVNEVGPILIPYNPYKHNQGYSFLATDVGMLYIAGQYGWLEGIPFGKGADGADGPMGPEGPSGPQGPDGPKGPEGPEGPEGPQGPQGLQGVEGPRGAMGYTGPAGPEGQIGKDGPQGPEGPAGPEGQVGPQGPPGELLHIEDDIDKIIEEKLHDIKHLLIELSVDDVEHEISKSVQNGIDTIKNIVKIELKKFDKSSIIDMINEVHITLTKVINTEIQNIVDNILPTNFTEIEERITTNLCQKINELRTDIYTNPPQYHLDLTETVEQHTNELSTISESLETHKQSTTEHINNLTQSIETNTTNIQVVDNKLSEAITSFTTQYTDCKESIEAVDNKLSNEINNIDTTLNNEIFLLRTDLSNTNDVVNTHTGHINIIQQQHVPIIYQNSHNIMSLQANLDQIKQFIFHSFGYTL